jgi:hypothetical protein
MTPSDLAEQNASQPDPMHLMEAARAHAASGRNDEALKAYLWCFDHGDRIDPSFCGVRTSFLVADILKLSRQHRPALDALVARRNACGLRLYAGDGTVDDADDFVSLNRSFRQVDLSVRLFESLPRGGELWLSVGWGIREFLLEQRRYSDLLQVFDPEATFLRNAVDLETPACDGDPGFKTALRDKLVRQCAPLVEALAGTGDHQRALDLARKVLRVVRRPQMRQTLIDHARRAGDLPLAEALKTSKIKRHADR